MSTPEHKLSTLLDLRKWGKMRTHHFQETLCKQRLEHDFGVDTSTLKSDDFESEYRWYLEDYELFLARIETSDESTDKLAETLFNKRNPPLIGGKKGIELLEKIRKKLDQTEITDLHNKIDLALSYLASGKYDTKMMVNEFPTLKERLGEAPDRSYNGLENSTNACLKKDEDGLTPLHHAAKSGNSDAILSILNKVNEYIKFDACMTLDGDGLTPLHYAVRSRCEGAIEIIFSTLLPITAQETKMSSETEHDVIVCHRAILEAGKADALECLLKFCHAHFSLEDYARIWLYPSSQRGLNLILFSGFSDNLVIQKVATNELINLLENKTEERRQKFLISEYGTDLLRACKKCGNTEGFNTLTEWLQPAPAATNSY